MAEFDILNGKLDQILTILQDDASSNTGSNSISNTVISSNSFNSVVSEIKTVLTTAMGNGISSFSMNHSSVNGQHKTTIEIKS